MIELFKFPPDIIPRCDMEFDRSRLERIDCPPETPGYERLLAECKGVAPLGYVFKSAGDIYVAFFKDYVQ